MATRSVVAKKEVGDWVVELFGDRKGDGSSGWFYHCNGHEALSGGIWIEGKILVDMDGLAVFPAEVCQALVDLGISVEPEYWPDYDPDREGEWQAHLLLEETHKEQPWRGAQ